MEVAAQSAVYRFDLRYQILALTNTFSKFMGKLSLEAKHKEVHSVLRLKITKEEPIEPVNTATVIPAARETVMPPSPPPPWD
ncbi:hypothetical protein Ndes2526B_g06969 [Nannochloris sp. 'desiccata']